MSGPPVFVVGMPRSGTTLLASILNRSRELAISPETHYFPNFWRACERRGCMQSHSGRTAFIGRWLRSEEAARLRFSPEMLESLRGELRERASGHADVLGATLERYARLHGKARWGEKTPAHALYVPTIQRLFPDARVVQIVRDPRDVVLSLRRVPWLDGNLVRYLVTWRACVEARAADPERYATVRYEDLLEAPEETVKSLTSFLEMEFSADLLEPERDDEVLVDVAAEPWKAGAIAPLDPSNREKWRESMSQRDRRLVVSLVGSRLERLGYDPDPQPARPGDRIYRWWRIAENAVLRAGHYGRRAVDRLGRVLRGRDR